MPGTILVLCVSALPWAASATTLPLSRTGAHAALQRLPLRFEPNVGQADPGVRFVARGAASGLAITDAGTVLAGGMVLRLVGARPHPRVSMQQPLPGRSHYFRGADPRRWRTDVPQFGAVRYAAVYPGIDLVFHGAEGTLEYDFELAPRADPALIRLRLGGAERATLDAAGNLVVRGAAGELVQRAPVASQQKGGGRVPVPARFTLRGREVRFVVGPYDERLPLVIDPVLSYSSYFGGNIWDQIRSVAYDRDGNMIVAGATGSTVFPLANPLQTGLLGPSDAFVAKLSGDGTTVFYSTYLGGSSGDTAYGGVAVDAFGNAVVLGMTQSTDFPVVNAMQPAYAGGLWDAFVAKLSPSGSALVFSTYLGGSDLDYGQAVAADRAGNVYLTGTTWSADFPLRNPIQPALRGETDFYVTRLDARGSLAYSTFLGSTARDIAYGVAAEPGGRAVVTGFTIGTDFPMMNALQPQNRGLEDGVIAKLERDGQSLVYSTYLGGTSWDDPYAVAVGAAGDAYVVGRTRSTDFPLLNPSQSTFGGWEDTFITKINPTGSALVYSTYLGGRDLDRPYAVAVDESGSAYVGGETDSLDFPVLNAPQPTHGGARYDGYAAGYSPSGQVVWATYLGALGDDTVYGLSAGRMGDVALGGLTYAANWPLVRPLQPQLGGDEDGFLARISRAATTPLALVADTVPGPSSDANAVLDPGETASAIAGWRYNGTVPHFLMGQVIAFSGPGPATYSVVDASAIYGLVPGGGYIDCYNGTGDCYRVGVDAPQGRPVQHWDATLSEALSTGDGRDWTVHIGGSFSDVARSSPYYRFVETLMHRGITAGCGSGQYCPGAATAREQMAVFVLVAQDGASPRACVAGQEMFADLPATSPSCPFVEELARRAVVAGCGNGNFCPGESVSREQMAVFTLATREGPTFLPPACVAGAERFGDVPASSPFCAWIEEMARRGIVTGCGGGLYCPAAPVTREQMGVFIAVTFRLSLATP